MDNEITPLQRLAITDAFIKACKDEQKKIRSEVDSETIDLFYASDVTQRTITLNGAKVGTISVRRTEGKQGKEPAIEDAKAFAEWLRTSDGGLDTLNRLITLKPELMLEAATADGELPDGCKMIERYEPAVVTGTTLRVQKQKVIDALGAQLDSGIRGILAGGE